MPHFRGAPKCLDVHFDLLGACPRTFSPCAIAKGSIGMPRPGLTSRTAFKTFLSHRKLQSVSAKSVNDNEEELRILACVHGPTNVPSLISLMEFIRPTNVNSRLKLYVMHLVELTERSSSIVLVQRLQKSGFPFINRLWHTNSMSDGVAVAFQADRKSVRVGKEGRSRWWPDH